MFYFYKYKINVSSLKPFPCLHTLLSLTQPINHPHSPSYGYIYPKCHHSCAKGTWMPVHSLTFPAPARGQCPCNSTRHSHTQHRPRDISSANHWQLHFPFILPQPECATAKATSPSARGTSHHPSALLGQELNSPHTQLLLLLSTYQLTTNKNILQKEKKIKRRQLSTLPTSASVGVPRNLLGDKTFFHSNNGSIWDAMPATPPGEPTLPPPVSLGCPCHGSGHSRELAPSPHVHWQHHLKNATSKDWTNLKYANKKQRSSETKQKGPTSLLTQLTYKSKPIYICKASI